MENKVENKVKKPIFDKDLSSIYSVLELSAIASMALIFLATVLTPVWADEHSANTADLSEVQEEWAEAIDSLKGYSVNQREIAVDKAGATLDAMDKKIEGLRQRTVDEWESLSADARAARIKALRELTEQRNELAEWYGGMKYSSSQAWAEVKQGFVDAYDVLQDAWQDAAAEFD